MYLRSRKEKVLDIHSLQDSLYVGCDFTTTMSFNIILFSKIQRLFKNLIILSQGGLKTLIKSYLSVFIICIIKTKTKTTIGSNNPAETILDKIVMIIYSILQSGITINPIRKQDRLPQVDYFSSSAGKMRVQCNEPYD